MDNKSFFRIKTGAQRGNLGDILLISPISFTYLTSISGLFAAAILCFLMFGTYTRRTTAYGQLIPEAGISIVYPGQNGIIIEKYVSEGQPVRSGDILYALTSDRKGYRIGDIQAMVSSQVIERENSMRDELTTTQKFQIEEIKMLHDKIANLQLEATKLDGSIEVQSKRIALAVHTAERYQDLLGQGFISKEFDQQKQAELLDQKARLQTLERDRLAINRELMAEQSNYKSLALKHQSMLSQINRNITSARQELTESEARRNIVITAPMAGVASGVTAEIGQKVDVNSPVLSIVPVGSKLQAQLLVPSSGIGFVRPGQSVLLRYPAYPYQKFGHGKGIVKTVSKVALSPTELGSTFRGNTLGNSEPIYRVTVVLASQNIKAFGTVQALQAGMSVEADLEHETRRLYEWVLEPLYSVSGKL